MVVVALLFFTGPAAAGLLGQRPQAIENRALAPFPTLADGWDFFPKLSQWATDHLPLRDRAVEANSDFSESVFGELPATAGATPSVILGDDGWLFYLTDLLYACGMRDRHPQVNDGLERLAALAQAQHKRFVSMVVPDKSTIEQARLPDRYPLQRCSTESKAELWSQLAAKPPPGYVDLLGPLTEARDQYGAVYKPQDTHWDDRGNVAASMALARALDPALLPDVELVSTGPRSTMGDLNLLRGRPGPTTFEGVSLHRRGVTTSLEVTTQRSLTVAVAKATSTQGAPLVPGRTLLLGDSFADDVYQWLQPFFAELDLTILRPAAAAPEDFAALFASADTIIVEEVERTFVITDTTVLGADFLAQVAQHLPPPAPPK
jgi:hypothetical protein